MGILFHTHDLNVRHKFLRWHCVSHYFVSCVFSAVFIKTVLDFSSCDGEVILLPAAIIKSFFMSLFSVN